MYIGNWLNKVQVAFYYGPEHYLNYNKNRIQISILYNYYKYYNTHIQWSHYPQFRLHKKINNNCQFSLSYAGNLPGRVLRRRVYDTIMVGRLQVQVHGQFRQVPFHPETHMHHR